MVTDRDKRFLSTFWTEIFEKAGVRHIATTAYNPGADGQSERSNETIEIALRYMVDSRQEGWADALSTIQGALQSSISATTGYSPFSILYGLQPRFGLASITEYGNSDAGKFSEQRELIRHEVRDAITHANSAMQQRNDEPTDFSSGWAYLKLGTSFTLPSVRKAKLALQRTGPFKILGTAGNGKALHLELPESLKIYPVISTIHLTPAEVPGSDPFEREIVPPPPDIIEGEEEYEVERILRHRVVRNKMQFLVRFKGYGELHDRWYDEQELRRNSSELVNEYKATLLYQLPTPLVQRRRRVYRQH